MKSAYQEQIVRVLYMLERPLEADKEKGIDRPIYYISRLAMEETITLIYNLSSMLSVIEEKSIEAFNNPDTRDINLYRAQKLAEIFQIFEYNGSTIERSGKDE